tara:strand:- start:1215 stop:1820 length:606 start_codon:yes stop_codon:yes gene_type:complete
MTVYTMFQVPIIHYQIENWEHNKKRILDVLPPECPEHADPEDHGLYTDFFLTAAAGVKTMPEYSETVIDIIKPYLADFSGERRIEFTDMWYQKYYRNVSHSVHNHGHSGWSSVIYVEFDPEKHEGTQYFSPFKNIWNGNLETFQAPVEEGDMVIFPATIAHEAPVNRSDTRRTIVSYNLRGHTDLVKKQLWDGDPIVKVPA